MFGLGKTKAIVGLDIGSSVVKAVEPKAAGRGFKVMGLGTEAVPPDSIVDGAIIGSATSARRSRGAGRRWRSRATIRTWKQQSATWRTRSSQ